MLTVDSLTLLSFVWSDDGGRCGGRGGYAVGV